MELTIKVLPVLNQWYVSFGVNEFQLKRVDTQSITDTKTVHFSIKTVNWVGILGLNILLHLHTQENAKQVPSMHMKAIVNGLPYLPLYIVFQQ